MAEQFREDPTKKAKAETGTQKAADTVMSPEAEARRKLFDQKSTAKGSLELLFKAYNGKAAEKMTSQDAEDPLVSSKALDEWSAQIGKALAEKRESRRTENPDLVIPLVLLAEKAFKRDPRLTSDTESKRLRDAALKTVQVLFERYPDRLDPNALNSGKFDRLLETAGKELERAGLRNGTADTLTGIGRDVGKDDPYRLVFHLDGEIESLTEKLAIDAYDSSTAGTDENGVQESHRSEAAKILPQLKALTQIRRAMSQRLLGREISPEDVGRIVLAKDELEKIVTPDQVPKPEQVVTSAESVVETAQRPNIFQRSEQASQTPERPVRTFNDVARELKAVPIKTVSEAIVEAPALVTPEIKAVILANVLLEIDKKIRQAKELNGRVGAKIIGNLLGITANANVYALPYLAGGGRGLPRGVEVVDYMKTAFGYDLRNDQKRAAELKQWTDMLD